MDTMRGTVVTLEQRVAELETRWQELSMKMEREIQAKVELAMMDLLGSRAQHPSASANAAAALQAHVGYMGMPSLPSSFGDASILQRAERSFGSIGRNPHGTWENPLLGPQAARAFSTASTSSLQHNKSGGGAGNAGAGGGDVSIASGGAGGSVGATLPPHPKQKSLPPPTASLTASNGLDPTISAGLRQMSGGLSLSSATNSSLLLRNAWEDKFFSTMMMSDGASRAASLAGLANGMAGAAGGGNVSGLAALAAAQQQMQNQQMVQNMAQQQMSNLGVRTGGGMWGGGSGGGGHESASSKGSNLKRQTTAEILLEAAGELGNSSGKGKGAHVASDEDS